MLALTALSALVALTISPSANGSAIASQPTQVRPLCQFARDLVRDGARRSPTLAGLIARIEESRVVVYVDADPFLKTRAGLRFVSYAGGITYVIVLINPQNSTEDSIAVVSHEFQHVAEILTSPWPITSHADLQRLYAQIGFKTADGAFESEAALAAEQMARKDLRMSSVIDGGDLLASNLDPAVRRLDLDRGPPAVDVAFDVAV